MFSEAGVFLFDVARVDLCCLPPMLVAAAAVVDVIEKSAT